MPRNAPGLGLVTSTGPLVCRRLDEMTPAFRWFWGEYQAKDRTRCTRTMFGRTTRGRSSSHVSRRNDVHDYLSRREWTRASTPCIGSPSSFGAGIEGRPLLSRFLPNLTFTFCNFPSPETRKSRHAWPRSRNYSRYSYDFPSGGQTEDRSLMLAMA